MFLNDATETKMFSKDNWRCSPMNVPPLLSMVHNYSIMGKKKNKEENCICHFHNHFPPGAKDHSGSKINVLWQSWGIQSEKSPLFLNLFFLDNKPSPTLSPFAPNILLFSLSVMSAMAKLFSEKKNNNNLSNNNQLE